LGHNISRRDVFVWFIINNTISINIYICEKQQRFQNLMTATFVALLLSKKRKEEEDFKGT
jgi:hypothetical protein